MADDLHQRIEAFLDEHHVMSLATLGPGGPHAANLFYARDGLALVWVSDADSQHSLNLVAAPLVAVTVAQDYSDFAGIRGLQMTGTARHVKGADERSRLLGLLETRYPFLKQLASAPAKLREAYARTAVYRFEPARIVLIDNTRSFGHKEILDLSV